MIHESSFTLLLRPVAPFEQISQTARDLHLLQSSCSAPAFVLSHGARSKLRAPRLLALAVWSACHLLASFMMVFGTKSTHIKEKEIFGGGTNMSELAVTMIPAPLFGRPGFKFKLTTSLSRQMSDIGEIRRSPVSELAIHTGRPGLPSQ